MLQDNNCNIFLLNNLYIMINFFKDSYREMKHIVWPTKQETKKYFIIVLSLLIIFWIYLFIAGSIFSNGMFLLKDLVK